MSSGDSSKAGDQSSDSAELTELAPTASTAPSEQQDIEFIAPSPTEPSSPIASPPPSSTSTLGLFHNRSTSHILQSLQRYSSYTFTAFLALHITNTSLLPLAFRIASPSTANATTATHDASHYLLLTRPYYQSPLMEPVIVVLPLLTHIASGIALRLYRRHVLAKHYGGDVSLLPLPAMSDSKKHDYKRAPWPRLSWQSMAGYLAIPIAFGHSFITRGLPLLIEGGSSSIGLDYVSHGYAIAPTLSAAVYTALVGIVGGHVVWGWAKWLGVDPGQGQQGEVSEVMLRRKRRWWGVWAVAGGVISLWWAGGVGVVGRAGKTPGWVGRVYDGLYAQIPVICRWV